MSGIDYYKQFCCGCGLCHSEQNVQILESDSFREPQLGSENFEFCKKYCFASINSGKEDWIQGPWGLYNALYYGYSTDESVKKQASSAGVLTAVCSYLLDTKMVDAIIHIGADDAKPWRTKVCVSTNVDEVVSNCGSRYAQSSPLSNISEICEKDKKYAFVGKPCDVSVLKNYQVDGHFPEIILLLSFFCAGVPSEKANITLIDELGCSTQNCAELRYRGNGWPGRAMAVSKDGKSNSMNYQESWGKILGRDIRKICRFCLNGTGEAADISCGDAWYLDNNGEPDFTDGAGRNVVFGRTEKGNEVLIQAEKQKYIKLERDSSIADQLLLMQHYQYERKGTMIDKVIAMKLFFRKCPNSNIRTLLKIKTNVKAKRHYMIFRGTIGRILRKRI